MPGKCRTFSEPLTRDRIERAARIYRSNREAAQALGEHDSGIARRHILPNIFAPILVMFSLDIGTKIIVTASLSFLGLGVQPPTADWGSMLADGRNYLSLSPHVATLPGLMIFAVALSFNLIGDGLRDALDPRLRG